MSEITVTRELERVAIEELVYQPIVAQRHRDTEIARLHERARRDPEASALLKEWAMSRNADDHPAAEYRVARALVESGLWR